MSQVRLNDAEKRRVGADASKEEAEMRVLGAHDRVKEFDVASAAKLAEVQAKKPQLDMQLVRRPEAVSI